MAIRLDLSQSTSEWRSWRKTRLGGTDTAKILEQSPYGTPYSCYMEKTTDVEIPDNKWMKRGRELEPVARSCLMGLHKVLLEPACFDSSEYPFMSASLDAVTRNNKMAFEIKCLSLKNTQEVISSGIVPQHYYIQVQKQMLVLGLDKMGIFFYYDEDTNILINVDKDKELHKEIIEKETLFWNNLVSEIPPKKSKKDEVKVYNDIEDFEFIKEAQMYKELCDQIKELESIKKESHDRLLALADKKEYKGYGITISKTVSNVVNYKDLFKKLNLDEKTLNKYTNERVSWKINVSN